MDILVYGAGVIGTLYAGRLQAAGNRVSILARGQRLEDIRRHGLVLENVLTGVQTTTPVAAVEQLDVNACYDLALIIVRRDQVASVVPELADNRGIPTLLFMLNNLLGRANWCEFWGATACYWDFPVPAARATATSSGTP
jgi:2-dehydropantoate 2-reductase